MAYGQDTQLGICFQNSMGETLTQSVYWIPHIDESFALTKETVKEQSAYGRFSPGGMHEGKNANEGGFNAEINMLTLGAVVKSVLGDPLTIVNSGSVYEHRHLDRNTDFDSRAANRPVTVVKQLSDGGSAHLYGDMVGKSLTISVANNELLKCSAEYVGGRYSQQSHIGAPLPTNKAVVYSASSLDFGGSIIKSIEELSITFDEKIEATYTHDTKKYPRYLKRSDFRSVEVSGTLIYTNQTEFQKFVGYNTEKIVINFLSATQIQSGYNERFQVILPAFRYTDFKPLNTGPGLIKVGFTGEAEYSVDSAAMFDCRIWNTQAVY
jgi:hypothetical protein